VLLECVANDGTYVSGDVVRNFWVAPGSPGQEAPLEPFLTASTIQAVAGSFDNGIYILNKTAGTHFGATLNRWRYVFRIWH